MCCVICVLWVSSAGNGAYVCTEYHHQRKMKVHKEYILKACSQIGVHISTLLQVKLGREVELDVICWICCLHFCHSQFIARFQDSSWVNTQVFVEWHVQLKFRVGSVQTCSLTLLSTQSSALKLCIVDITYIMYVLQWVPGHSRG
jgi:hypothetical protein